jgi:hypothetical protein
LNRLSRFRASLVLLVLVMIALPALSHARDHEPSDQTEADPHTVFLPMVTTGGETPPPPPPPPTGSLPAAMVGTWFNGTIPPSDFYNPTTGEWRDTNGLGQMYVFNADASYTYAGFLWLQNGACRTEVSTYQQGNAQANDATLVLTPAVAKTRTLVVCGSRSDSTTDGPFTSYNLGWSVADDGLGHPKLSVQKGDQITEYYRQGMVDALVGGWNLNDVASANFYDPATGEWATPANDGAWFRFAADGTYRFGEYGHGQDEQGCATTYWVYQEGSVRVSGGQLSYQANSGRARLENACQPGQVSDTPYVHPKLYEFTWELRDQTTTPKLAVSPLAQFRFIVFTRE